MMDRATINPDGSMVLHGFVPMKWRLLAIRGNLLFYHSPGGCWWDNGGKHYGAASIDFKEIEEIRPGNVEGSWQVKFKRMGQGGSFHPTPKEACREAMEELRYKGDQIAQRIADSVAGK